MFPTRGKSGLVDKYTGFEAQGGKFPCGITDLASGIVPEKRGQMPAINTRGLPPPTQEDASRRLSNLRCVRQSKLNPSSSTLRGKENFLFERKWKPLQSVVRLLDLGQGGSNPKGRTDGRPTLRIPPSLCRRQDFDCFPGPSLALD